MSAETFFQRDTRVPDTGDETVRMSGEYDLQRQDELRATLSATTAATVRLDMRDVEFMDSIALRELIRFRESLRADDRKLVMDNVPAHARRLFEATGLLALFDLM